MIIDICNVTKVHLNTSEMYTLKNEITLMKSKNCLNYVSNKLLHKIQSKVNFW